MWHLHAVTFPQGARRGGGLGLLAQHPGSRTRPSSRLQQCLLFTCDQSPELPLLLAGCKESKFACLKVETLVGWPKQGLMQNRVPRHGFLKGYKLQWQHFSVFHCRFSIPFHFPPSIWTSQVMRISGWDSCIRPHVVTDSTRWNWLMWSWDQQEVWTFGGFPASGQLWGPLSFS